ncbi:hypothetical protein AC579_10029 [Pseudocercospora musae]|uniref:Transcription initiation factor TFIID subunit 4 n=1 Tax=Pseudocercospora musae TaxID=113226 RepID=A0A139IH60_9PEZI|nr:hypothetical protein AC579_10029 [Pseudocercospora musae]
MAYQMSPPAQQPLKPPPQPYAPYQGAGSPGAQSPFAQPPAKRPRLSPDPRSPAGGSPMYAQSPMQYSNPYGPQSASPMPYSPQSYAASPQNSFNTPQPYSPPVQWPAPQQQPQQRPPQISPPPPSSSNSMPPPPRPNKEDKDERMGVEDIGDSLFGSGINLKDEENYLHSTWNNRHSQNESFNTTQTTSFGSSTMSPNNSFNLLTQGTSFGSAGQDGAFAGSMGQPRSQEEIENEQKRKRELAARRRAEKDQFHLNNQFLQTNCLRHRMHQRAAQESVRLNVEGVYVRNPEPDRVQTMLNANGSEGIVAAKPEAMIEQGSVYEHILTLVSLASAERLRGLVDEAYGLARARRYGDHGRVVPPEFADIATGEGEQSQETVIPDSVTGSQWDRPQRNSTDTVNGTSHVNGETSTPTPQPQPTISFQGTLNQRLRDVAERERQAEKKRLKKREARKRKVENAADETPAATPAEEKSAEPLATAAPVKVSKKEQSKKAKEAQASTEAQAFNQSNQTAAMMALGGKKNRYSWMSGGAANMPTNRFAKPNSGTATPKAAEPAKAPIDAVKKDDEKKKLPTWGDWREDDVHGKGIQLRDWILVLERDGREKKALHKAVNKLS